jgi:hypothetical protein
MRPGPLQIGISRSAVQIATSTETPGHPLGAHMGTHAQVPCHPSPRCCKPALTGRRSRTLHAPPDAPIFAETDRSAAFTAASLATTQWQPARFSRRASRCYWPKRQTAEAR